MNLDFETYSEAGTIFDLETQKFKTANIETGGNKRGLLLVSAYRYAEHHSTRVTTTSYSFDGGTTIHRWKPGDPPPETLLKHVQQGNPITAWNSFFEWCIWNFVCVKKYSWPPLPIEQTRCSMAQGLAWSLPGGLDKASAVMYGESEKDAEGKRIMLKLAQPRNPTKGDTRMRYKRARPKDGKESEWWNRLDSYCDQDVRAEINIAKLLPPLTPSELEVWKLDQKINARGIRVDIPLVESCLKIMKEAKGRAGLQLAMITNGEITAVSQATALLAWVNKSVPDRYLKSLELPVLQEYLAQEGLPEPVIKALNIRKDVGGNAPAKLVAMKYQAASDGRVHGILQYCGAQRTRRWAGRGIQTQNMPNGGPEVVKCQYCGSVTMPPEYQGADLTCAECGCGGGLAPFDWGIEAVEAVLPSLIHGNYTVIENLWKNPAKAVSGCLRSMLIPAEGHDFISSDYSAIEAVVMACMAGEQWIIDVFNSDGKLYERTGAKMTGIPLEEIDKGHHARKLGKVSCLAYQFQGARGAALKFGAGKFLTNKEIDESVKTWRIAAPNIVAYWHAVEAAAINATRNPGTVYPVLRLDGTPTGISFQKVDRALYCILPGGDWLTYVDAEVKLKKKLSRDGWKILELCEKILESYCWDQGNGVHYELKREMVELCSPAPGIYELLERVQFEIKPGVRNALLDFFFEWTDTLTYWGVGTQNNWMEIESYGGKLAENITQSTARFILSNALLNIEAAGYPIVMHTHDEVVSEIPEGTGSVEEYERIMSIMPPWAADWPIKAAGGWRGKRYRK